MSTLKTKLSILLLLVSVLGVDCQETIEVYGLPGEEIVLDPEYSGSKISSITWKHEKNKVAEWETEESQPTFFTKCSGSCELNLNTGVLKIIDLKMDYGGLYSVEINGRVAPKNFKLVIIEPVSKPNVSLPLCNETACTVTCKGEDTKYTQYSWIENGQQTHTGNTLTVWKSDGNERTYICVFSNSKSKKESDPVTVFPQSRTWIAGVPLFFSLLAVLGVCGFIYRRYAGKGNANNTTEESEPVEAGKDNANNITEVMKLSEGNGEEDVDKSAAEEE